MGAYELSCHGCNSELICKQIIRPFPRGFKEHRPHPRAQKPKSSFVKPLLNSNLGMVSTNYSLEVYLQKIKET